MEFVQLSGTDIEAHRIGLGTWAMGGWMWGGTDEQEAIRTIHSALHRGINRGINLIDTAPVYGFGVSEEIVGKAIAEYGQRSRVIIATKLGLEWNDTEVYRNSTRERIHEEINDSSPSTGQFAERQGRQVGENIIRVLKNPPTKPFRFKPLGQLCSIGGHTGVAELFGFHMSGFLAWFVWRGVYLFKLPSWAHRIQVGFDWAWQVIFPRDLSSIRTSVTDRVSSAHYQSGDYVFRPGDPSTNFYVIEKGEVEVLRTGVEDQKEEIVAILSTGSFFGERALVSNQPHRAAVCARTSLDVVVMGRNLFAQISKSLSPFRYALAEALNRRVDIWQARPDAYEILRHASLTEFIEPVPQPLLKPTDTLKEVLKLFSEHSDEFFYVSGDGLQLNGLLTMTDLFRTLESGVEMEAPVATFMTKDPVAISVGDTGSVAATTLRDYRLKWIPVVDEKEGRRILGYLSARKIMAYVLEKTRVLN